MAVWTTKKCPYCGTTYTNMSGGDQRKYGCPLINCHFCKKSFWDNDIVEPALYGFQNMHELVQTIKNWITVVLYGCMSLGLWVFTVYSLIDGFFSWSMLLIVAFSLFPMFLCFTYVKKTIEDKKNRDEILELQRRQYDESMERLRDVKYVEALAQFDAKASKLLDEYKKGLSGTFAHRP